MGSAEPCRRARITSRFRSRRAEPAAKVRDPVAGQPAIGFDLRLPRPAGPDPAAQPLEVGPQPPHAGEVVLELRELHLELSLGAVGVVGEDVEDHRGPVDHGHARAPPRGFAPGGAPARRRRRRGSRRCGRSRALSSAQLAPPQVAVGVGAGADLDQLAGGRHPGGAQELLELGERDRRRRASAGTTEMAIARWRARGFATPAPPACRGGLGAAAVATLPHSHQV